MLCEGDTQGIINHCQTSEYVLLKGDGDSKYQAPAETYS